MTLFPDTQAKAQLEIDSVIGSERLPVMEDRPSLDYVERLIQEVHVPQALSVSVLMNI
jgi:hypothetical protein